MRVRGTPIDPDAVAAAQPHVVGGRGERDAERVIEAASSVTRMKIVRALAETPLAASDLARLIGRTAAATSQHIRVLRDIDAIAPERSGNVVRYRLTTEPSAQILEAFARALDRLAR